MNTKAKSNSVITHEVNEHSLVFNVQGAGRLVFNTLLVSKENHMQAKMHGFIQRISDAAAISRDPETGQPASAQDKFDAMSRLVAHYESGTSEWSRKPVAGERERGGLLFKALCKMSPTKTPDEIRTWMDGKTKAQLSAIRTSAKVATVIESIRPVSADVDVDAMLDELE